MFASEKVCMAAQIDVDIARLLERTSAAILDCQTWRATGLTEKYVEAYDLVEALQLQLRRELRLRPAEVRSPVISHEQS